MQGGGGHGEGHTQTVATKFEKKPPKLINTLSTKTAQYHVILELLCWQPITASILQFSATCDRKGIE